MREARRWWIDRSGTATLLLWLACSLAASVVAAQDRPTGSAVVGQGLFKSYCRSCHGPEGHGDGPIGQYLTIPPADLTKLGERWKGEFDPEIVFRAIKGDRKVRTHGSSEMPIWGDSFQAVEGGQSETEVDQKIAHLVAYLESIQQE